MKLIIEIDEKIIEQAKHYNNLPYDDYVIRVADAIKNSTPLDDIHREITEKSFTANDGTEVIDCLVVMDIIDKHISGKEKK